MKVSITRVFLLSLAAVCFAAAHGFSARPKPTQIRLAPALRPGQKLAYLVSYNLDRSIKAQSRFQAPDQPAPGKLTLEMTLHVEILGRKAAGFRLRTYFAEPKAAPQSAGKTAPGESQPVPPPSSSHWVDFTLAKDGSVSSFSGLAGLPPVQQLAWREWLSRFAASMVYPKDGVKQGEKWETLEPESAPSPIAGLVWHRTSQYVRDEPCPEAKRTAAGDFLESVSKSESCAVILTTAKLKQESSSKDATPEDYKLNHLKTSGTAVGTNQTILYISRSTGLLMRSSESDEQSMNVTVALADGSNQVHYDMTASSRARLLLITAPSASAH
ncbi:MAG TPA: hypothetical protein VLX32_01625 [Candidatus Acidoferrum sp.]|nr:hypothetical protein [Candidatus Acidoferrum sp.]